MTKTNIRYVDDYNTTLPDGTNLFEPNAEGVTYLLTLAANLESDADECLNLDYPNGKLVKREIRRLAARVRLSGAKTLEEWMKIDPL